MTTTELTGTRRVVLAGLPRGLSGRLRASATGAVTTDWSVHGSVPELRSAVVSGVAATAPDVLVVGYVQHQAWSVRVLLSLVLGLRGAMDTRILLVTEGPRAALPVWLTDEPRLEVVAPDDVESRLRSRLGGTAP